MGKLFEAPVFTLKKINIKKNNKKLKKIISTEIGKLKSFTPPSEILPTENRLYFLKPTIKTEFINDKKKRIWFIKKEEDWNWQGETINVYLFRQLKENEVNFSYSFIEYFKVYKSLFKIQNVSVKIKRIKIFLKWLAGNENFILSNNKHTTFLTVHFFNFLIKTITKYKKLNDTSFQNLLTLINLNINLEFLAFLLRDLDNFTQLNNFNFLKLNITPKTTTITNNYTVKSNLYFTNSFKELIKFKYHFTKKEKDEKINSSQAKIFKNKPKYLKTKSKIIQYKEDHLIKDLYKKKYEEKKLYTATLIPEYGSWIRFGFQKNTKINISKYPIKNQEDEIIIQLDKVTQKPIIHLLKEMGITDLEICQNLQNFEFFYFNKPVLTNSINQPNRLLRFNLDKSYYKNISEFSRVFDPSYYRLGKIGRLKLNNRLNIKLSKRITTITYEDIFAIIDKLITLSTSKQISDDIDHLKNRRVRSVGELLQNLFGIGFQRLLRKLRSQTNKTYSSQLSSFNIVGATIKEFFGSSQLSQYMDQTNPLSSLTHRRRISGLGPGGFDRDRISFAVRDIHPSHYGRICPIETPEGQNVGLIASLTTCARVNKTGFIETPFWRVVNGKVIKTGNPIYLTADIEDFYKIAPADISTNEQNYLIRNIISVRYKQDFINVTPSEVDFISISPIQIVSVAASLIPFFEHDDANRALMGSNMQRQSVPLLLPQKPIVGTGLENQIALDSGMTLNAHISGVVNSVTANKIIIKDNTNKKVIYKLQKYLRSNQQTCINQRPIVWKGEKIKSGQILSDGPAITSSELSLGQNTLVA